MNREDVIRLAKEAGIQVDGGNSFADDIYIAVLYRFANLVEAQQSDRYKALAGELADVLQFIKRGNDCLCLANTTDQRLGFHTHECNEVRLALDKYDCSMTEKQEVRA
jgi:hypothetical protein